MRDKFDERDHRREICIVREKKFARRLRQTYLLSLSLSFYLSLFISTVIYYFMFFLGVAPFMSFLSNRQKSLNSKSEILAGKLQTMLFFGCRNADHDHLFKDEMEKLVNGKALSALFTAYSRPGYQGLIIHLFIFFFFFFFWLKMIMRFAHSVESFFNQWKICFLDDIRGVGRYMQSISCPRYGIKSINFFFFFSSKVCARRDR